MNWNKGSPPHNVIVRVLASDYMGEFEFDAKWVPYKNGHGGRWMQQDAAGNWERVSRKEWPEKWKTKDTEK